MMSLLTVALILLALFIGFIAWVVSVINRGGHEILKQNTLDSRSVKDLEIEVDEVYDHIRLYKEQRKLAIDYSEEYMGYMAARAGLLRLKYQGHDVTLTQLESEDAPTTLVTLDSAQKVMASDYPQIVARDIEAIKDLFLPNEVISGYNELTSTCVNLIRDYKASESFLGVTKISFLEKCGHPNFDFSDHMFQLRQMKEDLSTKAYFLHYLHEGKLDLPQLDEIRDKAQAERDRIQKVRANLA